MNKNKLIFAFLFLLFSTRTFSQTIEYDFLSRKFTSGTKIKTGEPVRFQLNNVNPFLYKVTINKTVNSFDFSAPDLFKKYMGIDKAVTKQKADTGNAALNPEKRNDILDYNKMYEDLLSKYNDEIDKLFDLQCDYEDIKYIIGTENDYQLIKKQADKIISSDNGDPDNSRILEYSRDYFKSIYIAEKSLAGLSNISAMLSLEHQDVIKRLKKNFEEVNLGEQLKNIKTIYSVLENKKYFEVCSEEITAKGDVIDYNIEIEPLNKEEKTGKPVEKIKMSYSFDVSGGLKIDFSSGIFFTNVYDKDYFVYKEISKQDTATITNYGISEKDNTKIQPGISALLHLYCRNSSPINFSLNTGVGVSMSENSATVRYLFGGSIIIGKEKRVLLNAGMTLGFVDVLRSDLKNKTVFDTEPTVIKEKEMKIGYFFGLSFNI